MESTMSPMREIGLGEPGSVLTRPQAVGMAGELSRVASPSARTGKPEARAPCGQIPSEIIAGRISRSSKPPDPGEHPTRKGECPPKGKDSEGV